MLVNNTFMDHVYQFDVSQYGKHTHWLELQGTGYSRKAHGLNGRNSAVEFKRGGVIQALSADLDYYLSLSDLNVKGYFSISSQGRRFSVVMKNVLFSGDRENVGHMYIHSMSHLLVSITETAFTDVIIDIQSSSSSHIKLEDIVMQQTGIAAVNQSRTGLHARLYGKSSKHLIQIKHSQFYSSDPNCVTSSASGALVVELPEQDSQLKLYIENSRFTNNKRALDMAVRGNVFMHILHSYFNKNSASGSGGAVRVIGHTESEFGTSTELERLQLIIDNCTFVSNIARRCEGVCSSSVQCSDPIKGPGSGGALYVFASPPSLMKLDGSVVVKNSNFTNNTAEEEGGSLFISSDINLHMEDVYIENSLSETRAAIGDVMYMTNTVTLSNVRITLAAANNDNSVVFYHAADILQNSIDVSQLLLLCPRGHEANQLMATTSGSNPAAMQSLQVYCRSCPPMQYSIQEFRLVLNGITADVLPHNHSCHYCPSGAICDDGIQNRDDFWGLNGSLGAVEMYQCPDGYCKRDETKSVSYSNCADHRGGVLCGRCQPGYSESLLGTACVEQSHCQTSNWLMLIFIFLYGLFYLLFFMFEHDWSCVLNYIARSLTRHKVDNSNDPHHTDSGYFQIFMYFIQTTSLLSMSRLIERDTLYTSIKVPHEILPQFLIDGIQKLLEFDFPLLQTNECFFPDLTPTGKMVTKIVFFVYLYALLLVLYIIGGCCCMCIRQSQKPKCGGIR